MKAMLRLRAARGLAWVLLTVFAIPYLGVAAVAAEKPGIYTQTVVLFPMDNLAGDKNAKAAEDLTAFMKAGLSSYSRYIVLPYSQRLPAIQRLISTQPDSKDSWSGPFSGDPTATKRALQLSKIMQADLAIIGSVDDCTFNPAKSQAEVTISVQVVDTITGKAVRTVTATGVKAKTAVLGAATEQLLISEAVLEAGAKAVSEITGEKLSQPVQGLVATTGDSGAPAKKPKKKSWIPVLLLSLGVGLLLGGHGGSSSSSGGSVPDTPPAGPF